MEINYKEQYEALKKRFDHLMQSEFIRGFDEYDRYTKGYKRDIKLADEMGFKKKNNITVNVSAEGLDDILEKTGRIALNLERAAEAKERL